MDIIKIIYSIMDNIKSLKSQYIYIYNNYIYGTDADFINLRMNELKIFIGELYIFDITELGNVFKLYNNIRSIEYIGNTFMITLDSNELITLTNRLHLCMHFNHLIKQFINIDYNMPQIDLTENDSFNKLQEYKSADGVYKFNYNGYLMSLYNNIIPRNKSDKVLLDISDHDDSIFIACFTTIKKKIGYVKTYFGFIKLK